MGVIQKQGIQNTIISYLGIIIGFVNVLILQPTMLSPDELGLTRILYSTATLLGTVFPLGLNGVTIKFLPQFRNAETGNRGFLGFLLLASFIFSIIMFVILFLFKDIIIEKYATNSALFVEYIYYILPLTLAVGFISIINVYFFAQFKTTIPSFLNEIYIRLLLIVIVSLYFIKIIPFEWFMRFYLLIFISQLTILVLLIFKNEMKSFLIDWTVFNKKKIKELLSFSLTMALATIASIALRNIDILIIGIYLPLSNIAIYTIAVTIAGIVEAPSNALGKIADSKISNAFASNNLSEISEIYSKSTRILMVIGFVLFTLITANITELLSFLPQNYRDGENVIIIVSLSALFNMMTGINSSIIFYSNKHKQGTVLLVFLIISSIILNIVLIPKYGIIGAAIATSLNLFLYNLVKLLMIYYYFKLQPFGNYVWKIVVVSLVSFILCNFIHIGIKTDIILKSAIICMLFGIAIIKFNILPEFSKLLDKYR
jgi:O-antigen/teichoic acid export membrane protein